MCITEDKLVESYGKATPRERFQADIVERLSSRITYQGGFMITVNLYYKGINGNARAFADEMESSGIADAVRAEDGNLRYEYFQPLNDPETILLIDSWSDQAAIDAHHASPMPWMIPTGPKDYAKLIDEIDRDRFAVHMDVINMINSIIVSHHHGRIPYAVPPMMVLPEIRKALAGRDVKIIVDCGIASGADVFKALALGADAAAVGRSMLPSLEKDGVKGVCSFIKRVGDELRYLMSCTGYTKVSDIDDSVIHYQ